MIQLIKPYVGFEDIREQLEEILDSGMLTKGKYSKAFPQKVAEYVGARHGFLTTSATTALSMCLKLVGLGPEDEVLVSDFSFPATVNVVEDLGAKPVFVDVSRETFNMLPDDLEAKITDRAKACLFVDALGNPSGLLEIARICRERGVVLIEDAACAIGSSVAGRKCGSIADLTCFSLHPRKLLTCGEGGVITTDDDDYADLLRVKLNHGADPSTGEFVSYGYNYRMAEIPSMMGLAQIGRIDEIVAERREERGEYKSRLEPLGFVAQAADDNVYHNMQSVTFVVPDSVSRDDLCGYLKSHDIECTIGTYCLSDCVYYRDKYDSVQPNAKYLQDHTITLPCYSGVPVSEVCDAVEAFVS